MRVDCLKIRFLLSWLNFQHELGLSFRINIEVTITILICISFNIMLECWFKNVDDVIVFFIFTQKCAKYKYLNGLWI